MRKKLRKLIEKAAMKGLWFDPTDKIMQLLTEAIPEEKDFTDKFYGKSEIDAGFEQAYNQCIKDIKKNLE